MLVFIRKKDNATHVSTIVMLALILKVAIDVQETTFYKIIQFVFLNVEMDFMLILLLKLANHVLKAVKLVLMEQLAKTVTVITKPIQIQTTLT